MGASGFNWVKTTILLAFLTVILVMFGGILGGRGGMLFAFIIAAVINLGAYWFSDTIVLKMYKAQEVTPESSPNLYGVVTELAQSSNMPVPKVYLIDDPTPNAFATGRSPEKAVVAATTGILRMLTREELKGVMAHEMTHVRNRDTLIGSIAATVAGAIAMLAQWAQWAAFFGGSRDSEGRSNIIGTLLFAILAPMAAGMVQMAISRTREYMADKGGAEMCGNPLALASALAKLQSQNQGHTVMGAEKNPATAHMFIVNPLSGKRMMNLFATHPPMDDRIAKLEEMHRTGVYPK